MIFDRRIRAALAALLLTFMSTFSLAVVDRAVCSTADPGGASCTKAHRQRDRNQRRPVGLMDAILHILLGLTLLFSFHAASLLLGPMLTAGLFAAFYLYSREVTQLQGKHFNNDFRRGWDFWNWSREKNVETWIPVAFVMGVAMAIEFGVK